MLQLRTNPQDKYFPKKKKLNVELQTKLPLQENRTSTKTKRGKEKNFGAVANNSNKTNKKENLTQKKSNKNQKRNFLFFVVFFTIFSSPKKDGCPLD